MVVELPSVLEPDQVGAWLSSGHADEDDLVAQLVLVVEVGRLGDLGALGKRNIGVSTSRSRVFSVIIITTLACL